MGFGSDRGCLLMMMMKEVQELMAYILPFIPRSDVDFCLWVGLYGSEHPSIHSRDEVEMKMF